MLIDFSLYEKTLMEVFGSKPVQDISGFLKTHLVCHGECGKVKVDEDFSISSVSTNRRKRFPKCKECQQKDHKAKKEKEKFKKKRLIDATSNPTK